MVSWVRARDTTLAAGHGVFYVVMVVCFVVFVTIGCVVLVERDRPWQWGTFTETSTTCDRMGRRTTCESTGRWVSDDATIVKGSVRLDGSVGPGASVRAAFRPGGLLGDEANNIVHTDRSIGMGLWFPWVAAAITAGMTWYYRRRWRAPVPAEL